MFYIGIQCQLYIIIDIIFDKRFDGQVIQVASYRTSSCVFFFVVVVGDIVFGKSTLWAPRTEWGRRWAARAVSPFHPRQEGC